MPVNDFLPFATNSAANVVPQSEWLTDAAVPNGFTIGVADSDRLNKAWRQPSFIAAGVAQFVMQTLNQDVLDNGNLQGFVNQFVAALGTATGGSGFVTEAPAGGPYGRIGPPGAHWAAVIDQNALNAALGAYVRKAGDVMTGSLGMSNNHITSVILDAQNDNDRIQIKRTASPGASPGSGSLSPGEFYVQMGDPAAPKLWVGVDTAIDGTGRRLLADLSAGGTTGNFLPLTGGTLTGQLGLSPAAATNPTILWQNNTAGIVTTGGLWRTFVGPGGFMNFMVNTSSNGDFSSSFLAATMSGVTSGNYQQGDLNIFGALKVNSGYCAYPCLTVTTNGYTNLLAPDVGYGASDACISIGSTSNGTNFYRNANHQFQNRGASATYLNMGSSQALLGTTGGPSYIFVVANGNVQSLGANAGFVFGDRTNAGTQWIWYASGAPSASTARLYAGADRLTVDGAGNLNVTGGMAAPGTIQTGGDLYLYRQTQSTGYLIRPNVQGYRNLSFACVGAASLDTFNVLSVSSIFSGWISAGGSPTPVLNSTSNAQGYTTLYTPDNFVGLYLGASTGGGNSNYYRNEQHIFQNRAANFTWLQMTGGGAATFGGALTVNNNFTCQQNGSFAGTLNTYNLTATTGTVSSSFYVQGLLNPTGGLYLSGSYGGWTLTCIGNCQVTTSLTVSSDAYFYENCYINWSGGNTTAGGNYFGRNVADRYDGTDDCGYSGAAWAYVIGYQVIGYNNGVGSDPAMKQDIAPVPGGALKYVMDLEPKTYRWRDKPRVLPADAPADVKAAPSPIDNKLHWGWMAPDVAEVMGDGFGGVHLSTDERHPTFLNTHDMLAVLWAAVRELSNKLEEKTSGTKTDA